MTGELEFILKKAQSFIRRRKLAPAETLLLDEYKKWAKHPLINLMLGEIFFLKDNVPTSLQYLKIAYEHGKNISSVVVSYAEKLRLNYEGTRAKEVLQLGILNSPRDKVLLESYANFCLTDQNPLESLKFNSRLLLLFPNDSMGHTNIAEAYAALDNYEKSLEHQNIAIKYDTGSQVKLNRAITLLTLKEYEEGWAAYESRLGKDIISSPRRRLRVPRWNRQPLQNKTILVCSEQGVGDELYFSSYLPKLIEISGKVILETDPRLTNLFKESLGEISVFPFSRRIEYEQPVFNYGWLPKSIYPDFYIDLASLPHFLTEKGMEPLSQFGYLKISKDAHDYWTKYLFEISGGRPIVGLCWRSGLNTIDRQHWYPPLHLWEQVLTTPNICFLSLQYDDDIEDIRFFKEQYGISMIKLSNIDLKNDLKKIGAICSALTGVIAPSTAVAHLAAAVGKSTIIIENTRTWCPTINGLDAFLPCIKRIFPPNTGDWEWVFNGVRKELNNWLSSE